MATADAVSRRTASVDAASRARRCETSVDIVVMSTGSTGVSAAQKATSGPSAAAASRLPWATRAQCCTSTSVERISVCRQEGWWGVRTIAPELRQNCAELRRIAPELRAHLHELRAALVDDLRVELRVKREVAHGAHYELLQVGRARVPALDQRPQPAALTDLALAPRVPRQAADRERGVALHEEGWWRR